MFKKNQSNLNFSIKTVMYSYVARRAGADDGMEHLAKMVNGLSRGLFSLRALPWMFD